MKSFWENAIERGLQTHIRQAKRAIIVGQEAMNDHKIHHPNEIREYATNQRFTEMEKRIKEQHKKEVEKALLRRNAIGAGKR